MTRRGLLVLLAGPRPRPVPPDEYKLNPFAEQYNRYVEGLQHGVVDVKQWERVVRAWERMVGAQ